MNSSNSNNDNNSNANPIPMNDDNNVDRKQHQDSSSNSDASIMKYLTKCGLDTSNIDFSLDDVDKSSMALLIQLSQGQGGDGSDSSSDSFKNETKVDNDSTDNNDNINTKANANDEGNLNDNITIANSEQKEDEKENFKPKSIKIEEDKSVKTAEEGGLKAASVSVSNDIKKDMNGDVDIRTKSRTEKVLETASVPTHSEAVTKSSTRTNTNTNSSTSQPSNEDAKNNDTDTKSSMTTTPMSSPTRTATNSPNQVKKIKYENRDFEQILAQYNLDSHSFSQNMTVKKSTSTPCLSPRSKSKKQAQQNEDMSADNNSEWQKTLLHKFDEQNENVSKCQDQIQSLARLIAQDMVERRCLIASIYDCNPDLLKKVEEQSVNPSTGTQESAIATLTIVENENNTISNSMNRETMPTSPNEAFQQNNRHQGLQMDQRMDQHMDQHMDNDMDNDMEQHMDQPMEQPIEPQQRESFQTIVFKSLDAFFNIYRQVFHYINSTRTVRVIKLIKTEAQTFRENGGLRHGAFIDWSLIMKLFFFLLFLFARFESYDEQLKRDVIETTSGKGTKKALKMLEFWQAKRAIAIFLIALSIYFIKTGLWKLLRQILVKDNVFLRVWKGEDLNENNNDDVGEDAGIDGNPNNNRDNNNSPPRRGRRDREPIDVNNGANNDNNNVNDAQGEEAPQEEAPPAQGRVRGRLRNVLNYIQEQTFIGGHIDHRVERNVNNNNQRQIPVEQILLDKVIDSAKDVLYFFGSFFLSLFPMWHPRARQVPIDERNNRDDNAGHNRDQPQPQEVVGED